MIKVLSTRALRLHALDAAALEWICETGVDGVEISAHAALFSSANAAQVRDLARWFAANPLQPWALHAPQFAGELTAHGGGVPLSLLHSEKSRRIEAMDEIKRAIECAFMIPFRYLVLPMAQPEIEWSQETIDHGITALEHLGAFAAQLGMKLLLKASSTEAGQPARLIEMLTAGRFRTVMLALNTAEASIAPGLQNAFAEAGDRLQALYLADLGTLSGLWPGTGLVDWPQVRALAKTLPGDAALVLETEPDSRRSRAEVRQLIQKAFELVS